MPRPNSTSYGTGAEKASLRNRLVEDVVAAISARRGQTLFEIAEAAGVSLNHVRKVMKLVPAARELLQDGYVAVSAKGPIPRWAADVPDVVRATSTALVSAPELPKSISHKELREEVTEKVDTFRRLLRKTYLSPKSQRRELDDLADLEVFSAEREQQHMDYIRRLEEQRESLEAFNKTLREHAELLKFTPSPGARRGTTLVLSEAGNA